MEYGMNSKCMHTAAANRGNNNFILNETSVNRNLRLHEKKREKGRASPFEH
jgi:hypothetical protein